MQKPVSFLRTKGKLSEREIKKTTPFTMTSRIPRSKLNHGEEGSVH